MVQVPSKILAPILQTVIRAAYDARMPPMAVMISVVTVSSGIPMKEGFPDVGEEGGRTGKRAKEGDA